MSKTILFHDLHRSDLPSLIPARPRFSRVLMWILAFIPSTGAVGGWFTLPIAVLAHEISEFVVIGSGLRMLRT